MPEKNAGQCFYYPQLDGLRFFAFLLVFIHNALPILTNTSFEVISRYGWIGVDLFFCISAFLITKILLTEQISSEEINKKNYFLRRILKIFPQYLLYIVVIILIKEKLPASNTNIEINLLGLTTFTYNYIYFYVLPSPVLFFIHLWTISFEIQYYIALPFLVEKIKETTANQKRNFLLLFFVIGCIIRTFFIGTKIEHPAIYFIPFTHFDSVIGGVAVGMGLFDKVLTKINGISLFLLGLVINALVFLFPNNDNITWHLMLTYPFVGAGMSLLVLGSIKNNSLIWLFGNKIIVSLGKISYGLYLYHILSFYLTNQLLTQKFGLNPEDMMIQYLVLSISFLITTFISILTFRYIEKPFLSLKPKKQVLDF